MTEDANGKTGPDLYGPGTPCPLHGKPLGPPPARNCEDCRAGIDRLLVDAIGRSDP